MPRHSRRSFDSSSKPRSGEDHQTSIASRSRWNNCGDVRDALDGSLRTVLEAVNGPPALSLRDSALLGRRSESALPNQRSVLPDANWCCPQRYFFCRNRERFLAPGYGCVPRAEWLRRYTVTMLPKGDHFWYKGEDTLWWLGKISASTATDGAYLLRFFLRRWTDQASSFSGALHDFDRSCTRSLASTNTLS